MWHDSIIAEEMVGDNGSEGGGTLETPSAVMRTRLPSNLERRNELCSALSATVCKFCCRYVSAYASPRRMPSAAGWVGG